MRSKLQLNPLMKHNTQPMLILNRTIQVMKRIPHAVLLQWCEDQHSTYCSQGRPEYQIKYARGKWEHIDVSIFGVQTLLPSEVSKFEDTINTIEVFSRTHVVVHTLRYSDQNPEHIEIGMSQQIDRFSPLQFFSVMVVDTWVTVSPGATEQGMYISPLSA